jgi:hypothetical protein
VALRPIYTAATASAAAQELDIFEALTQLRELGASVRTGAANRFYQFVSARYERASLIVTSNKVFGRLGEVFGGGRRCRRHDRPTGPPRRSDRRDTPLYRNDTSLRYLHLTTSEQRLGVKETERCLL